MSDPDKRLLSWSLNSLAAIYYRQGQYVLADSIMKQVQTIDEKRCGVDSIELLDNLYLLFDVQMAMKEKAQAKLYLIRMVGIAKKRVRDDDIAVAYIYHRVGILQRSDGEYVLAAASLQKALAVAQHLNRTDHALVGSILNEAGHNYIKQKDFAAAEKAYTRSLDNFRKVFQPDHPEIATVTGNLACIFRDQGRYSEAKTLLEQVLEVRVAKLGRYHPDVAKSLRHLGRLYQAQNHLIEAAEYLKWAEKIESRNL